MLAITSVSADLIYSELKNESFLGDFIFQTEDGTLKVSMEKSKINSSKVAKSDIAGRVSECNGITQQGGRLIVLEPGFKI